MDISPPVGHQPGTDRMHSGKVPAQLIEYEHGHYAAVAAHAGIEVLNEWHSVEVPGAAHYCRQLLHWRDQWLPLLELSMLLTGRQQEHVPPTRCALVVAWQPRATAPLHCGGLVLPVLPHIIQVGDDDHCALPANNHLWRILALSCFEHESKPVPILDLAAVFSPLPDWCVTVR